VIHDDCRVVRPRAITHNHAVLSNHIVSDSLTTPRLATILPGGAEQILLQPEEHSNIYAAAFAMALNRTRGSVDRLWEISRMAHIAGLGVSGCDPNGAFDLCMAGSANRVRTVLITTLAQRL
jgi:hypothetical protein